MDDDAQLARAAGAGDQAAFRALYDRYAGKLMAFARSRYRTVAEDVCSEAWLRAVKAMKAGQEMTNFRGWLFRVADNLGKSRFRGQQAQPMAEGFDPTDHRTDEAEVIELTVARTTALGQCLAALREKNPPYADAIAAWMGGTGAEFAAANGIERNTYDQRVKRAKDALQKCLEPRLK